MTDFDPGVVNRQSYSPIERGMASSIWRPQRWGRGLPDFSQGVPGGSNQIDDDDAWRPAVMRRVSYGRQDRDTNRVYVQWPDDAHEHGGTSCGGVFVCLPGQRVNQYERVVESQAFEVFGDNVYRAYGTPDLLSGGVGGQDPWFEGKEVSSGDLVVWFGAGGCDVDPAQEALRLRHSDQKILAWGKVVPEINDSVIEPDSVWSSEKTHAEDNLREPQMNSLLSGGRITQNATGPNFDVSAGEAADIDHYTDPELVTGARFSFGPFPNEAPVNFATTYATYLLVTPAGGLTKQNQPPTQAQLRTLVLIGLVVHDHVNTESIPVEAPIVYNETATLLRDFMTSLRSYSHIIGFDIYPGANPGGDLTIQNEYGQLFLPGINWHNDPLNPNRVTTAASDPMAFSSYTATTQIASGITLLDPGNYDPGGAGTLTSIPGSKTRVSIQYVFVSIFGQFAVQYGQSYYGTLDEAREELGNDWAAYVKAELYEQGLVKLKAAILIESGASDTSDPTECEIINVSDGAFASSGGGGGGVSTFVALTDTPATFAGAAGKVAAVNTGETALEFISLASGGTMFGSGGQTALGLAYAVVMPADNGKVFVVDPVTSMSVTLPAPAGLAGMCCTVIHRQDPAGVYGVTAGPAWFGGGAAAETPGIPQNGVIHFYCDGTQWNGIWDGGYALLSDDRANPGGTIDATNKHLFSGVLDTDSVDALYDVDVRASFATGVATVNASIYGHIRIIGATTATQAPKRVGKMSTTFGGAGIITAFATLKPGGGGVFEAQVWGYMSVTSSASILGDAAVEISARARPA